MSSYHFNNRAEGIFAEGFFDCDGKPVRDTFVWQMRAKLVGIAGRNWSRAQNADLAASFSSAEMNAIMCEIDHPHVRIEFDMDYYGGDYTSVGQHAYVPEALIDLLGGDVAAALAKFKRIDPVHMVGYSGDERFDADGEPLEEFEVAAERCA